MTDRIVLMDFTGVYREQQFYRDSAPAWLELQQLSGCNCYCDAEAGEELRSQIRDFSPRGIHYLDSGNYHYMSLLWLEKINTPFRLLLFDNHTDMQPPAFGGLLSCGGWAAEALEKLSCLKELVLVGPDQESFDQAEPELRKRTLYLSRERLAASSGGEVNGFFEKLPADLPFYLSVDKDVLCPDDAATSWSQGDMRLRELEEYLEIIFREQRVLGMDVCGECDPGSGGGLCNDRANDRLLNLWKTRRNLYEE